MSKKIQLSIPTPCHENWDVMTPVEKGKFCGSCQKQVVDFSKMNDRDIAQFFKKPSIGSVCGRFMSDQLERDIEIPRKRIPWLKYFFQFALPAFFFSKASGQKTMGQISRPVSKDTIRVPLNNEFRTLGMVMPTHIVPVNDTSSIKMIVEALEIRGERGKVIDAETGLPLEGAVITMVSTIGTEKYRSDKNGQFVLNTIRKITVHSVEITYPGYDTQKMSFAAFMNLGGKHIIRLQKTELIVGDIKVQPKEMILGEMSVNIVKGDTIIKKPVCAPMIMGKIAMPYQSPKSDTAGKIKGLVVDEKENPLPGAVVKIKGASKGTWADNNGEFLIKAKKGDTLIVFGVGLKTTEKVIDNSRTKIAVDRIVLGMMEIVTKKEKEIQEVPLMLTAITDANAGSFKAYPNPVASGSSLSIEWKQNEEGYFNIQLLNQGGQSVNQQEVWIDAEARVLNMEVPAVPAGSYFLVLTNKKSGKKVTEKIIIQ
ncbi:MAG: carboxypeptidase-like regulatory domain-containing protein [Chitinophagaceae bacterium]